MASTRVKKDSLFYWVNFRNQRGERDCIKTDVLKTEPETNYRLLQWVKQCEKAERQYAITETPSNVSVKMYSETWFEHRETTVKSFLDDRSRIETHVLPHIGTIDISDIRHIHLQKIFDSLKEKHTAGTLASGTIRSIYAAVKVMFRDAAVTGLVNSADIFTVDGKLLLASNTLPSVTKKGTLPYKLSEVEAILQDERIPEDRRVLYALLFFCGLRFGEGAALKWGYVDWTAQPLPKLPIVESYSTRRKEVGETKTGFERYAPMHPSLESILRHWKEVGFKALFGREPTDEDYIVPSRRNKPRSSNHMLKKLKKDVKMIGLSVPAERKLHAFRASYVSVLRNFGVTRDIVGAVTHGRKSSSHILDAFYTTWDWQTLCDGVLSIRYTKKNAVSLDQAVDGVSTFSQVPENNEQKWRGGRDSNSGFSRDGATLSDKITCINQHLATPSNTEREQTIISVDKLSTVKANVNETRDQLLTVPILEPVDFAQLLSELMPKGWHELPIGKR